MKALTDSGLDSPQVLGKWTIRDVSFGVGFRNRVSIAYDWPGLCFFSDANLIGGTERGVDVMAVCIADVGSCGNASAWNQVEGPVLPPQPSIEDVRIDIGG